MPEPVDRMKRVQEQLGKAEAEVLDAIKKLAMERWRLSSTRDRLRTAPESEVGHLMRELSEHAVEVRRTKGRVDVLIDKVCDLHVSMVEAIAEMRE